MRISMIAAMDKNRLIGYKGTLPWHLPSDLKYFKKITLNKTVLMGRKTFDSIGHPLHDRRNIVLSRNPNLKIPGCEICHSLEEVWAITTTENESEIVVIGGTSIYSLLLPLATKLYLTVLDTTFLLPEQIAIQNKYFKNPDNRNKYEDDHARYFPVINENEWNCVSQINYKADLNNPYCYCTKVLAK